MGRSKFPGKPAKHVNRKRINVLPPPTSLNVVVGYNNTVTSETDEDTKQVNNLSVFTSFACQAMVYWFLYCVCFSFRYQSRKKMTAMRHLFQIILSSQKLGSKAEYQEGSGQQRT